MATCKSCLEVLEYGIATCPHCGATQRRIPTWIKVAAPVLGLCSVVAVIAAPTGSLTPVPTAEALCAHLDEVGVPFTYRDGRELPDGACAALFAAERELVFDPTDEDYTQRTYSGTRDPRVFLDLQWKLIMRASTKEQIDCLFKAQSEDFISGCMEK